MLVSKLLVLCIGRSSFGAASLSAREPYHTHVCSFIPARNAVADSPPRLFEKGFYRPDCSNGVPMV